jgi:hypothetical protein
MAEGVSEAAQELAPAGSAPPAPAPQRHGRLYRFRFAFLYGSLAAVLGAAVAGFVLLVGSSDGSRPGQAAGGEWSPWKPSSSDTSTATKEIAQHVAKAYRHPGPDGAQLLKVLASAPAVQSVPIHAISVQANGSEADAQVDERDSLMFILCGSTASCAIGKGTPSVERGRLVRREALELALYTFKYVEPIKYVVAFMPPRKGQTAQYVVFYQRSDLEQQLRRPLRETLNPVTPRQNDVTRKEIATIDRLTLPRTFKFQLQQAQQGDAILVLTPSV